MDDLVNFSSALKGKHLIIRADACLRTSTGHLMRRLALAQAWKDAGGEGLLQWLYDHFQSDTFSWKDALGLLKVHPEWLGINQHVRQKAVP